MKRTMDVFSAIYLLIVLTPLLMIIALFIKMFMGSPILFKQQRPGLHGAPFYLYKFRTMLLALDDNGKELSDAKRLTSLGKILRKYSLDELPQLINVLKGEMSLVGPRPLLMEYIPLYTKKQFQRHDVKPGITGWAQINGRNAINWEDKFALDIWYVQHHRFLLDCKIVMITIFKVLKREGINQHDRVPMLKFDGSKEGT